MKFLFTCGGTAGHINPAIAVAGRLKQLLPDSEFLFVGAEGNMEEERRLFYVAVTRARRRLLVSACLRRRKQNQTIDCVPSPFLQEIPPNLIQNCAGEAEFTEAEGEEYFGKLKAMFDPGAEPRPSRG